MTKLVMLKGLPASGKSTYARKLTERGWVRVNKDELRDMLHGGKYSRENEAQVIRIRDEVILDALNHDKNVVVDDTNFNPVHESQLRDLAAKQGAEFEIDDDFLGVSLDECIARDLKRPVSVGETVIRRMYNQFVRPKPPVVEYDSALPDAIICDIDGTLAHMVNRGPYDTSKYLDDEPDELVPLALRHLAKLYDADSIIVSGRSVEFESDTKAWLAKHGVSYDLLLMRPAGDTRKDYIVKQELYEEHIKGKYNVRLILDDRNQVVDMWRSRGLQVFQVAEGDF